MKKEGKVSKPKISINPTAERRGGGKGDLKEILILEARKSEGRGYGG